MLFLKIMNQFNSAPQSLSKEAREGMKQEYIALARELSRVREGFPFPGVHPESYPRLKAAAEEFPEYSAPIDELIGRLKTQGMKVVLSTSDPQSGNIFILPLHSDNIEMDNLFPRHLMIKDDMDKKLRRLIILNKELQ